MSEKKADAQAPANSAEEFRRQCAGFREFFDSVSYAGGIRPVPATADDIGEDDD